MTDATDTAGLSTGQVAERVAAGLVNVAPRGTVRTIGQIVFANVITPVNAIMLVLFGLILLAGYPADGLFVGVVVSNSLIGIAQELYARRELHRLEVLNAPHARVRRDGGEAVIDVAEVVVDDVIVLAPGGQVVVDGTVVHAGGLEVDESLLTGESDPVLKRPGDEVLAGSFVSAGSGLMRAVRVGADSYAATLAAEARRFTLVDSELRAGINRILRWLVIVIPPASILLMLSLLDAQGSWRLALQGTVAAAVAMVPDGLVLLTSLSFVAGVIAIARRQALAKELATVELLARVDTLCLDKTGTITTGDISLASVVPLGNATAGDVAAALGAVAASDPSPNATMAAIKLAHPPPDGWRLVDVQPFSAARKWSAATFADRGTYCVGAPDVLFAPDDPGRELADAEAAAGRRVLLVTRTDAIDRGVLSDRREPLALILLEDEVRSDAREILSFFADQGVHIKVISGDNVATVAAVAKRAGVPAADAMVDARELDDVALLESLEHATVFGRVTPHQKRAMVGALQAHGRVVAMTGDGVNDVLALKDADMGIAMGSGSEASRGVAQLVLLDNRFATLPEVLAQGRKVINNIERVANLFVTKAMYALLLTALIGLQRIEFPFLPRQLTLIGTFSIGVPGFVLALAPNVDLVRPGFLRRVLRLSIPAGCIAAVATWLVYLHARARGPLTEAALADARSAATITLLGIGLVVLVVVSRPLRLWKVGLAAVMAGMYALILAWPRTRHYFELTIPDARMWAACAIGVAAAGVAIVAVAARANRQRPPAGSDGGGEDVVADVRPRLDVEAVANPAYGDDQFGV